MNLITVLKGKTMSELFPPIRRLVTGEDASGRAVFIEDGPSKAVKLVPERPGYRVTNIWHTGANPSRICDHKGVLPPERGTVIRVIDYPPEPKDPNELARMQASTFASLYPDADHTLKPGDHPGMHKTDTIDYALMLEGEITSILEGEEKIMKAGDILIQRGTNHAWANRSGKPARIAFILIDAKR
jgi:gentisate 1,2-dioxygenase